MKRNGLTRSSLLLASALLGGGLVGCGGDSIEMSLPDGDVVPWEGSIEVVASITEQGNKPRDGEEVTFSTTVGSFAPYGPEVTEPMEDITVETRAGVATATLYSFPGQGGEEGMVSAAYTTIAEKPLSASIPVSIADGGKASGKYLSGRCDPVNVTALDANGNPADPDMEIRCTLSVKDVSGNAVPIAEVRSEVEQGCTLDHDEEESESGVHVFVLKPDCLPFDVEPWDNEPFHQHQGIFHNPRDGLLTILFYVRGQEGFTDSNGNGIYDSGEGFVGYDQPEPFLDVNDNNQWDSGEFFVDNNDDGRWNPADGRWNDDTWIWTTTHIMFTGPPHESAETTHFDPPGISIDDGGNQTLVMYLMDQNHNPLAVNDEDDHVEFEIDNADITQGQRQALHKSMGVVFNNGAISIESMNQDRSYQVTLADARPGDENPRTVTLSPEVNITSAPRFRNYRGQELEYFLTAVTGTAH